MKALSVKQPFAGLIAQGKKTIETRTWKTNYRGPVLICASKTAHNGKVIMPVELQDRSRFSTSMDSLEALKRFPAYDVRGVCLCVVDLVDCRTMTRTENDELNACCRWYFSAWAWVLENPRPVKRKTIKGKLGLFDIDNSLIEIIR